MIRAVWSEEEIWKVLWSEQWCLTIITLLLCTRRTTVLVPIFHTRLHLQHLAGTRITTTSRQIPLNSWEKQTVQHNLSITHITYSINRALTGQATKTMLHHHKVDRCYNIRVQVTTASEVHLASWQLIKPLRTAATMNISTMAFRASLHHPSQCLEVTWVALARLMDLHRHTTLTIHVQHPSKVHMSGWRSRRIKANQTQVREIESVFHFLCRVLLLKATNGRMQQLLSGDIGPLYTHTHSRTKLESSSMSSLFPSPIMENKMFVFHLRSLSIVWFTTLKVSVWWFIKWILRTDC